MILHYTTAGVMATYGVPVDQVDGNTNLRILINGAPGKAVISLSYIFTGIYGLTWAPIGWIYASEVFPLKYRAKGVGLSAATNWVSCLYLLNMVNLTTNHYPDLQLRARVLPATGLHKHHLEDVYRVRNLLHGDAVPHLLHL